MPTYERIEGGRVVETVTPVEGDHEDTRLGVAALDRAPGADGWRDVDAPEPESTKDTGIEGQAPADPTPTNPPTPPKPKAPRASAPKDEV